MMTTGPSELPAGVRPFFDVEGRLKQWPAKLQKQLLVLAWLADHFERGRTYSESEVNEILQRAHTFDDWALLRRALFDYRHMDRKADGSSYWRREPGRV